MKLENMSMSLFIYMGTSNLKPRTAIAFSFPIIQSEGVTQQRQTKHLAGTLGHGGLIARAKWEMGNGKEGNLIFDFPDLGDRT